MILMILVQLLCVKTKKLECMLEVWLFSINIKKGFCRKHVSIPQRKALQENTVLLLIPELRYHFGTTIGKC